MRDGLTVAGTDPEEVVARARRELLDEGLDADALANLGIDLDAVRARAEAAFGAGALDRAGLRPGHLPFTTDAKKALELALREAIRLHHRTIDSRHVLLGILRADSPGRTLLAAAHADTHAVRAALEQQFRAA